MKAFKFLAMMVAMLAMSVSFSSCSSDDDDPPTDGGVSLAGTFWSYTETAEQSGVTITYDYSITFSATTAVYKLKVTEKKGNASYEDYDTIDYSYSLSESGELVIFTPLETGKAYLEGEINSGIKMTVTNTSTNKVIGVFYKK